MDNRRRAGSPRVAVNAATGRNGKQYVAVTAATQGQGNNESRHGFALP
jgi:hypothetical protein